MESKLTGYLVRPQHLTLWGEMKAPSYQNKMENIDTVTAIKYRLPEHLNKDLPQYKEPKRVFD